MFIFCLTILFNLDGPRTGRAENAAGPVIEGAWTGTLEVMGTKLRIVFRAAKDQDGSWKTQLDSPDQGAQGIPVNETIIRGDSLFFKVTAVAGAYEGLVQPDGITVKGTWKQGGMSFPLELTRTGQAPVVNRPQEPKPPFPYRQEEVAFMNGKAGITLSGTLTLPETGGPFTAVVMITGSGAQDRDEQIFGHRPFWVIADYLTRRGVAVLRYDDRGTGKSTGDLSKATSVDLASDALSAVEFLKSRKDINHKKIGLAGHSEGAILAPMVANQSRDVAFVILLAGPGMTGEKLLYLQGAAVIRAQGIDETTVVKNETIQHKIFSVVMAEKDDAAAGKKLRDILNDAMKEMTEEEKARTGFNEAMIDQQVQRVLSPWFRYFLSYDPLVELKRLRCPVLALWGEKDLQVPPNENAPPVEEALKMAGNKKAMIKVLPGLNHLFQTSATGSVTEYGSIEETFSPTALAVIGDWIAERIGK